jgi:hypothetical protein
MAGVLVAVSGPAVAVLANVGAYAVSAVLLLSLPRTSAGGATERGLQAVRRGWREVRGREWLWLTVAWFSALQCVAQAPLLVLGPEIARRTLGGSAAWGLVLGGLGAGAAAGAALAAVVRLRRPLRMAIAAYALYALPLLALAKPLPLPLVASAAVLAGGSAGFFGATWFSVLQRNVPRDAISRISAWDWQASLAGLPLGMLLAPQIARLAGVPLTLVAASTVTVALTLAVARRSSLATAAASVDASGEAGVRFRACAGATSQPPHRSSRRSARDCSRSSRWSSWQRSVPTARRASTL